MHICSKCKKRFKTEDGYLGHKCVTGYTPKDQEHLGKAFLKVSMEALRRGGSLTPKRKREIDAKIKKLK